MKLMSARWTCLLLLLATIAVTTTSVVSGSQGRWKDDGNGTCYWDPNDDGPDQCVPPEPTGRWKVAGDGSCYFEPTDSGPDQCVPPVVESATDSLDDFLGSLPSSTAVPVATTRSTAAVSATAGS